MGALADSEPTAPGDGLVDASPAARRGWLLGLRMPVGTGGPVTLVRVDRVSLVGRRVVGRGRFDGTGGQAGGGMGFTVYLDEDRLMVCLDEGTPAGTGGRDDEPAAGLVARLGRSDGSRLGGVHGDALLLLGADPAGDDTDVPDAVVTAARKVGWLPAAAVPTGAGQ